MRFSQQGPPFTRIGADGGLLPAPVRLTEPTTGGAERFDVTQDFPGSEGATRAHTVESLEIGNAVSCPSSDRCQSAFKHVPPDGRTHACAIRSVGVDAEVSRSDDGHPLRLAVLLAFPTIGLEQLLHTDRAALTALPMFQALHWLSDSLLVLPLAAFAVWGGQRLATKLGLSGFAPSAIVGRACLIAMLFAIVLVPGAALHDVADRLTHVHSGLPTHSHIARPAKPPSGAAVIARFVGHALSDGVVGQSVGLPVMILVLAWQARKQRPATGKTIEEA